MLLLVLLLLLGLLEEPKGFRPKLTIAREFVTRAILIKDKHNRESVHVHIAAVKEVVSKYLLRQYELKKMVLIMKFSAG